MQNDIICLRMDPIIDPTDCPDTPGSDRIVEVLLEDDPRPVKCFYATQYDI